MNRRTNTTRVVVVKHERPTPKSEGAKQGALKRGLKRSQSIVDKVTDAMASMEQQIADNGGVYPNNDGEITMTELAERADISLKTFYAPKHKLTLGARAREWVKKFNGEEGGAEEGVSGSTARKPKSLAQRYEELHRRYQGVLQSHRDTELTLQQQEHDLETALEENSTLKSENASLRGKLADAENNKVVALRPMKPR